MNDKKEKNTIKLSRLQQLMNQKESRSKIAKDLGCDVSTITKHFNGDRAVTTEYLLKYAKYFCVSADYLLGISDVSSADADIKSVCKFTGLGSTTVNYLHQTKDCAPELLSFMSFWLSDLDSIGNTFDSISQAYDDYIQKTNTLLKNLTEEYFELKKEFSSLSDENLDNYLQVGFDIRDGIKKIENWHNYFDYLIYKETIAFIEEMKRFLFEDERIIEVNKSRKDVKEYLDEINSVLNSKGFSISAK